MSKKINKTTVADALKVIAEALTASDAPTETEAKREPETLIAIYGYNKYSPADYNGRYITDPAKLKEYYKIHPEAERHFNVKLAGAPRWTAQLTKDNDATARKGAREALAGLKALSGDPDQQRRNGYETEYRLYEIKELSE